MIGQYRGKQLFAGRLFVGRLFGPSRQKLQGGGPDTRRRHLPSEDDYDAERMKLLRHQDETLLLALAAAIVSRRMH